MCPAYDLPSGSTSSSISKENDPHMHLIYSLYQLPPLETIILKNLSLFSKTEERRRGFAWVDCTSIIGTRMIIFGQNLSQHCRFLRLQMPVQATTCGSSTGRLGPQSTTRYRSSILFPFSCWGFFKAEYQQKGYPFSSRGHWGT